MKLPDGREALVRFALPLPLTVVAELCTGVRLAVEEIGYTNVDYVYDGEHAGFVVATPPAERQPAVSAT